VSNNIRRFDPTFKVVLPHISKELFDTLVWPNARVVDLMQLRTQADGQITWSVGLKLKEQDVTHYVSVLCKKEELKSKVEQIIQYLDTPDHKHHNED
jgi:hypothetical protein